MDIFKKLDLRRILRTDVSEDELTVAILNYNYDDFLTYIDQLPPSSVSPPLKPNQTRGTEKISIRLPRYIIDYYRAESIRTGIRYQKLINIQLAKPFKE